MSKHVVDRHEAARYPRPMMTGSMAARTRWVSFVWAMWALGLWGGLASPVGAADDLPLVPVDDYPVYDLVIQEKFLTSQTHTVIIERQTVTQLIPTLDEPPTAAFFSEREVLPGRLPRDLVADFVTVNQRPAKLEPRFAFGVRYRLVRPGGGDEPEVHLPHVPVRFVQGSEAQPVPATLSVLKVSRVGFSRKGDLALVYTGLDRPDGAGGGMVTLLRRTGMKWEIVETELLWVARPD